jgi:hypothetical protein
MPKRKKSDTGPRKNQEAKRLRAIYAKSRAEFSAADLQRFTVLEKGVPLENVIAEMEKIHKRYKPRKA